MPPGTFGKPAFMDCIREEYHACREGVGIMDLSSFTKIEIKVYFNIVLRTTISEIKFKICDYS